MDWYSVREKEIDMNSSIWLVVGIGVAAATVTGGSIAGLVSAVFIPHGILAGCAIGCLAFVGLFRWMGR